MSQVFSGDSVNIAGPITLPTSGETTAGTGNFLNPPFQNAKAMVMVNLSLQVGTGTTTVVVRIRRNPSAENLFVMGSNAIAVTPGNTMMISLQAADVIPDGRPVQYAMTVLPAGATGNGSMVSGNISTILISG